MNVNIFLAIGLKKLSIYPSAFYRYFCLFENIVKLLCNINKINYKFML